MQINNEIKKYIDIAGVMYVMLDGEGRVVLVNKTTSDLLGYSEEELTGKNWFDLVIPEKIRDQVKDVFVRLMRGEVESVEYYENEILTKEGKKLLISWHNSIRLDNEGNVVGTIGAGEDITEKKRIQKELTASEEKYRNIVTNSNQLFYIHDTKHIISYVSPQSMELLGYTSEEMMVKWTDLATNNPINEAGIRFTEEAIRTGVAQKPYNLELLKKDGEKMWVEVNENPIKDENDKVEGMSGALTNVTDKIRREKQLKNSNLLLEKVLDASYVMIAYLDREFNFVRVNKTYAEADGKQAEYFVGKNHFELYPNEENKRIFKEVVETGKKYVVEAKVFSYPDHPDWGKKYFDWTLSPIKDEKGWVEGVVLFVLDVTDRENRKRDLMKTKKGLDNSYDVVFMTRYDGVFEYVNKRFVEFYGYSFNEVVDKTPRILKSGRHKEEFYSNFWKTILSGKPIQAELINKKKNGEEVVMRVSVNPIQNEEGKIISFLAVQRDITNIKKSDREIQEKIQDLEKLNKLMVGRELKMAEMKKSLLSFNETQRKQIQSSAFRETSKVIGGSQNKINDSGTSKVLTKRVDEK